MVKSLPAAQETWVWSLVWEDPLEKEMPTYSSFLAWEIPWMEEPGGLQSMGSQRVRNNWVTNTHSLRLHVPVQGHGFIPHAWVSGKIVPRPSTTKPVHHNGWDHATQSLKPEQPRARAPGQETPPQWGAHKSQLESRPPLDATRESPCTLMKIQHNQK